MAITVPDTKVTRATVYRDAGDARLQEAEFLSDEHPSGAIHLAGYLIECYLKWALCQRKRVQYLQDLADKRLVDMLTSGRGHNIQTLCQRTGYAVHFAGDGVLERAFQVVATWSPSVRYIRQCGSKREAAQFLAAARTLRTDIQTWADT